MKTQLKDLEVNAVTHCNLACIACNHGSPIAERYWMLPSTLERDLGILNQFAHWELCMIQGGEPTLRQDLHKFMLIIKDSGICDQIGVLTNGTLLDKMPDIFWETARDVGLELRISVYPVLTLQQLDFAEQKCKDYGIKFRPGPLTTHFMKMFKRHEDKGQAAWDTCPWKRCWTVHEGFLYCCPTSAFFPKQFPEMYPPMAYGEKDGYNLSVFNENTMDAILNRKHPLETCAICVGHGVERVEWGQERDAAQWIAKSTANT